MSDFWTDRDLEGIRALLGELGIDIDKRVDEGVWCRCHNHLVFFSTPDGFRPDEWEKTVQKLQDRGLISKGPDSACDINYGRLVPLFEAETITIRMPRRHAKDLCDLLGRYPFASPVVLEAKTVIEMALRGER